MFQKQFGVRVIRIITLLSISNSPKRSHSINIYLFHILHKKIEIDTANGDSITGKYCLELS